MVESKDAHIAVVVKCWPRLSETFIAQEMAGLEARGLKLVIYSLRLPTDPAIHPVHARVKAPIVYLPDTTRVPQSNERLLTAADGDARLWVARSEDANEAARAWRARAISCGRAHGGHGGQRVLRARTGRGPCVRGGGEVGCVCGAEHLGHGGAGPVGIHGPHAHALV